MAGENGLSLKSVNQFLLSIGSEKSPHDFCDKVILGLRDFTHWDLGRIMYHDEKHQLSDIVVYGVNNKWNNVYLHFCEENRKSSYNVERRKVGSASRKISVIDWRERKMTDADGSFLDDYIRPQHLTQSVGFALVKPNGNSYASIMFDKTHERTFSEQELSALYWLVPHVRNFFTGLFTVPPSEEHFQTDISVILSKREYEIASLIAKGYKADAIAKELYISTSTIYRHVANIHNKLGVSNQIQLVRKYQGYTD